MITLELEEWQGLFDSPRTTLVEVAYEGKVRRVLRRFDMTSLELVQLTAPNFSINPPSPRPRTLPRGPIGAY